MAAVSSDSTATAEELSVCGTAEPVSVNSRAGAVVIPILLAVEVGWLAVLGYVLRLFT